MESITTVQSLHLDPVANPAILHTATWDPAGAWHAIEQGQSAYNGHFESTCYHPLLLFSHEGDCLAAKLRPGNVHSAEGWEELLLPEIERQQRMGKEIAFRADAAFAKPEIYEALEERGVKYAIRIPSNDNLERDIAGLVPRPVGRPASKPWVEYKGFL